MNINRRSVLLGLSATAAVASTGLSAAIAPKVPLSESAIFDLPITGIMGERKPSKWASRLQIIKVEELEDGIPQLGFRYVNYNKEMAPGIHFDDGKNVDEYYIKNCKYFERPTFNMSEIRFEDRAMQFALTSAGNSIAQETRRGCGNHIVLHPERAKQARELGYTIGRPFHNMIERDWMPMDEVFVFYKGNTYDQPGILFPDGKLVLPDGFSYGRRIKFKV